MEQAKKLTLNVGDIDTYLSGTSLDIHHFSYQSGGVGINETQFTRQYQEGVSGFIQILKPQPEIPRLFSKQLLYKLKGAGNTNSLSIAS